MKSIWNDIRLIFTKWSLLPLMVIGKWSSHLFLDPWALSSCFAALSHQVKEKLGGHWAADQDQLTTMTPTGLSITYWNVLDCWRSDDQLHELSSESLLFISMNLLKDSELVLPFRDILSCENYTLPTYCLEILRKKKPNYMKMWGKIWPSCIKGCYAVETIANLKK